MDDALTRLQEQSQQLFAGLLGIRIIAAEPDLLTAEIDVRPEVCTVPGIMHGGAIMAFADTLGAFATSLNLPPGHGTTTMESKTNFFAPGIEGTTVRAETTPLHKGRRTQTWQTRVIGSNGKLLALITQTQMVLEPR